MLYMYVCIITVTQAYSVHVQMTLLSKHYCTHCTCRYRRILVLVSHSQDFLNGICTNIIHLHKKGLVYYSVSIIRLY